MRRFLKKMKFKPEDRTDEHGSRITSIKLADRNGNIMDTYVGDFVTIRQSSNSEATNEVGVVDGFTPQRTRVLVKDKRRFFLDKNLVFFQAGPLVVRYEQQQTLPVLEDPMHVVQGEVEVEQAHQLPPGIRIEDEEPLTTASRRDEINNYFDQLENVMEACMEATVAMNIHIERGRQMFRAHRYESNLEEHLSRIRIESERRWEGFSDFVAEVREKMRVDIN